MKSFELSIVAGSLLVLGSVLFFYQSVAASIQENSKVQYELQNVNDVEMEVTEEFVGQDNLQDEPQLIPEDNDEYIEGLREDDAPNQENEYDERGVLSEEGVGDDTIAPLQDQGEQQEYIDIMPEDNFPELKYDNDERSVFSEEGEGGYYTDPPESGQNEQQEPLEVGIEVVPVREVEEVQNN